MSNIITREQWGAQYRNGVGTRSTGSLEKYLHHDAFGSSPGENASFAQDAAHMRAIERVGQQRFGGGISYTFGISRAGRIFQGAGVNRISYHSGSGRNTRGTGWVLFGNYENLIMTAKQLAAAVWLLQYGVKQGWWGDPALTSYHQQFRSTACPGKHAISKFSEINRRGRGQAITAPKPTPTAPTPKPSGTQRVNIGHVMRTNRKNVPVYANRGANKRQVGTMHGKGYRVHVLYREGTWARIRFDGGSHWVAYSLLETDPGTVWPHKHLPSTNSHTRASHNAWVRMLAGVGFTDKRLTLAIQKWLQWNGYYRGYDVDGKFQYWTTYELQRFLKDRGFYKGKLDGKRESMTIKAEIAYINSQAKHYR